MQKVNVLLVFKLDMKQNRRFYAIIKRQMVIHELEIYSMSQSNKKIGSTLL